MLCSRLSRFCSCGICLRACMGHGCGKGGWSFPSGTHQFFSANTISISAVPQAGAVGGAAPALGFFSRPTRHYLLQSLFGGLFVVSASERVGVFCFFFLLRACILLPAPRSGPQMRFPGGLATLHPPPPPACPPHSAGHLRSRGFCTLTRRLAPANGPCADEAAHGCWLMARFHCQERANGGG